MNRPLRIGIIGPGAFAEKMHIPGYKQAGDGVELVAVAGRELARAERVAREHGFARDYDSYEEMLAREQLDAVSVCTPNRYHAPAAIAALKAGAHVLCEKPPAMNPAEVEAMIAAAREAGRVLLIGLSFRFHAEVEAARRFVQGGALGEVYAARARWTRRRGIPSWGVFTSRELQGGGPLMDIGVHVIDIALHLMGYAAPAQMLGSTYAKIGTQPPGPAPWGPWDWQRYEVEDMALGMVKLTSGATLMVEASFADNAEDAMQVRLSGTKGGLELFPLRIYREEHGTLTTTTASWLPPQEMYREEMRHFLACCRGEEEPRVGLEEALWLQQIINGLYESAG
ncbi:MAG: Gfo/Idh/MocA family protein [Bacillota bacterium]